MSKQLYVQYASEIIKWGIEGNISLNERGGREGESFSKFHLTVIATAKIKGFKKLKEEE